MIKTLIELFVFYLLYKIIFDFIIPVYQTTKQVKKKVNQMQQDMNDHIRQQHGPVSNTAPKNPPAPAKKDDYIDFEEVK